MYQLLCAIWTVDYGLFQQDLKCAQAKSQVELISGVHLKCALEISGDKVKLV